MIYKTIIFALLIYMWTIPPCFAITDEQEVQIGKKASAQAEKKYGVVKDPTMQKRVQNLGAKIAAKAQRKKIKYKFSILNSKEVNALAFPGGYIYFTKGILNLMDDKLLAFVAGHEVSHVEHRDSVKAIESAQRRQIGMILVQKFIKGADASWSKSLMSMTNSVISNRYSQSAEFAADKNGIYLMAAAGYDPYDSISSLKALKKVGGKDMPGFLNSLLSTHPITNDRIERAQAIAPEAAQKYGIKSTSPEAKALVDPQEKQKQLPQNEKTTEMMPENKLEDNETNPLPKPVQVKI